MKKQLLIAAVAATMTSVAFADISITGGSKINYTNVDSTTNTNDANTFNHDIDFTIVGKSGDTSVSMTVSNATTTTTDAATADNAVLTVENAYMTSKVADVNVKVGQWTGSDSLLGNGTRDNAGMFSADTTISGVKVQFEDRNGASASVTVSGSVAGVALSHEKFQTSTDTKISGSVAGVDMAYRSVNADAANSDKTSLQLSTEVQGMTLTYAKVDVDGTGTTTSDGYLGTFAAQNEISGFGVSTAIAGNTVSVKSIKSKATSTAGNDKTTKVTMTRPLASGATFEATYTNFNATGAGEDKKTLDLELAVKF